MWSHQGVTISASDFSGNTAYSGGAIHQHGGTLNVATSHLTGNTATTTGGALSIDQNDSYTNLLSSTFSSNSAADGGAIFGWDFEELNVNDSDFQNNQAKAGGGLALRGTGTVSIDGSSFSGNTATTSTGGAAQFGGSDSANVSVSVTNTDFIDNTAVYGGGIANGGSKLVMHGGSFIGNSATEGGGFYHVNTNYRNDPFTVHIEGVSFSENTATERGGGFYSLAGSVQIVDSSFENNAAPVGGAVWTVVSGVRLDRVTLTGNTALQDGGAIAAWDSLLLIESSTLSDNHAGGRGGAMFTTKYPRIVNSTISGNSANLDGGGVYATHAEIHNSTIVLNRADADGNGTGVGGGVFLAGDLASTLSNSIIAGNETGLSGAASASDLVVQGVPLEPASGYNLIGDPNSAGGLTNGANGNLVGDGLGGILDLSTVLDTTLADNGGPTLTHALLSTSPAVNAGSPVLSPELPQFDQRGAGYARVTGANIDIGAFEYGSAFENVIAGRHVFYNNSSFDEVSTAINPFDVFAIDPSKQALLPDGSLAAAANVTSYSRGINGVMLDLAGSHPDVTAADFIFRVGATNDPGSWAIAPAPSAIQVLAGQGVGGADRIVITWPDDAILNTYLQVIVAANANTGLAEPDAFFFGNRVGDSFSTQPPASFVTSAADELAARNAAIKLNLDVTNPLDFDKSGRITAADMLIARNNPGVLPRIQIAPPAAPLASAASDTSGDVRRAVEAISFDGNAIASALRQPGTGQEALPLAKSTAPAAQQSPIAQQLAAEAVLLLVGEPSDSLANVSDDDVSAAASGELDDLLLELALS